MKKSHLFLIFIILSQTVLFSQEVYNLEKKWGGHGGGAGLFNRPLNLCIDDNSNMYVVDDLNGRVQKFNSSGSFISFIGRKGYGEGEFDVPYGICIDNENFLYVSDAHTQKINKFTLAGAFIESWSISAMNIKFSEQRNLLYVIAGEDHQSSSSVVTIDKSGNVVNEFGNLNYAQGIELYDSYVLTTDNSGGKIRISKFDLDGQLIDSYTTSYDFNQSWPLNHDIEIYNNKIYLTQRREFLVFDLDFNLLFTVSPTEIDPIYGINETGAIESNGDKLFISLLNHFKVYSVDENLNPNFSFGNFGGMGPGFMNFVTEVAIDYENEAIYVADYWDCKIQKFSLNGQLLHTWGSRGLSDGNMILVSDIALDNEGNIYAADRELRSIHKYSSNGGFVETFSNSQFGKLVSIFVDKNDYIYISNEENKVLKLNANSEVLDTWTGFDFPRGLAVDEGGYIYLIDRGQNDYQRVQKLDNQGNKIASVTLDYSTWGGNPRPSSIVIKNDLLYVLDDGDDQNVKILNKDLELIKEIDLFNSGSSKHIIGMDVDDNENIYISGNYEHMVYKFKKEFASINIESIPDTLFSPSEFIINWEADNVEIFDIYISYDETDYNWELIQDNFSSETSHSFVLPRISSNNCYFKVASSNNSEIFDISNKFVIDTISYNDLIPLNYTSITNAGRKLETELTFYSEDSPQDSIAWKVNDDDLIYGRELTYPFRQGSNFLKKYLVDEELLVDSVYTHVDITNFQLSFENQIGSTVSINEDGGLSFYIKNDGIYYTDDEGQILHSIAINGISDATVSIDQKGNYYFAVDNQVYGYDNEGESLWPPITLGVNIASTIVIDDENYQVVLITEDNELLIYNSETGLLSGSIMLSSGTSHNPIISNDNLLYIIDGENTIKVFDLEIEDSGLDVVREYTHPDIITSSLSLDFDKSVYFNCGDKLNKISLDEENEYQQSWELSFGANIIFSPVIDTETRLLIGTENSKVHSIDGMAGEVIWSTGISENISAYPVLSENNYFYLTDLNGTLYCADFNLNLRYYYHSLSNIDKPLLYHQGAVYLCDSNGKIISIYDDLDNQVYKTSSNLVLPWGTFQGNNRRSGKQPNNIVNDVSADNKSLPTHFKLYNNYPNPFNPSTTIKYEIPTKSKIDIKVYDILGREVKTLLSRNQQPGVYETIWNGTNNFNSQVASGVYLIRMVSEKFNSSIKVVFLK